MNIKENDLILISVKDSNFIGRVTFKRYEDTEILPAHTDLTHVILTNLKELETNDRNQAFDYVESDETFTLWKIEVNGFTN